MRITLPLFSKSYVVYQLPYYAIIFIIIAHDKDTDFLNIPSINNQMT